MLNEENIFKVYELRKSDRVSIKTQSSSLTHNAVVCTTTKSHTTNETKEQNPLSL